MVSIDDASCFNLNLQPTRKTDSKNRNLPQRCQSLWLYQPCVQSGSRLIVSILGIRSLPDPRIERTKLHEFTDILFIVICATLCSMEGWEEIEDFAHERKTWLKKFINLKNGVPSHDTLRRVFGKLDPKLFQTCFIRWVDGLQSQNGLQVIAIDGKTVRGSTDKANGRSAIHMVSAWACENQLVLGQIKVDEKSNEITAIPELLDALFIENSVITIDAMGCQKSIAEKIRDNKADYLLSVKNNHKHLYTEIESRAIAYKLPCNT